MEHTRYAIRGGHAGRERLRVLARVFGPTTLEFFDRVGLATGQSCLDVGCGGGDVTAALARSVGPDGCVVGMDIDATALAMAREETQAAGITNVEFREQDIREPAGDVDLFDLVYARFVLTHLPDPANAVHELRRYLRPDGRLLVEEIDFDASFCHPQSFAYERYCDLYCAVVRRRGGDPCIGPRVPSLLLQAGFTISDLRVAQPAGIAGEVKIMAAITLENIADAVINEGLATRSEVDRLVADLYAFAEQPDSIMSVPRIVQVAGRQGVAS
jgi:SAM-dependent methyltransferase